MEVKRMTAKTKKFIAICLAISGLCAIITIAINLL